MKNKKPEIRFKGFSEDWEEKELSEIYTFQYGQFNINPSNGGTYPVYGANGVIGNYSEFNAENSIVIGHMGEYAGSVIWVEGKHFVTYNGTITTPKNGEVKPKYGYYLLHRLNINKICGGSGQPFLAYDKLNKLKAVLPLFKEEQVRISDLFSNLDNLITLHQRKYEKLGILKKAMLEKMFPKNGADVPEIRFKGFSGAWEEKTLGEIAEIIGGGTPSTSTSEYWGGEIDWYSPTEIGPNVYAEGSVKKITELGLQKSSAKVLPPNKTILFTSRAGIGDMAILKYSGATNQGFQSFVMRDNTDVYFVYSMGHLIKKFALTNASGSTFLEISGKILGRMNILTPCEEEQEKIGIYFKNLDSLLTLRQVELGKLKNLKKAMLEKMFV